VNLVKRSGHALAPVADHYRRLAFSGRCCGADGVQKGQESSGVGHAYLFFPPSLLILLFVPKKSGAVPRSGPSVVNCPACGGAVSNQAELCPHCGQPQRRVKSRPWYGAIIEIAGVAAVVISIVSFAYFNSVLTASGLPTCDASWAKAEVNRALANAPFGKVYGLAIISFDAVRTDQSSENVVSCFAHVTLNNTTKHELHYSFTKRDEGNYYVEAQIVD